jgi:DNA-directed RNA polymerase specialized sigma24 family protein
MNPNPESNKSNPPLFSTTHWTLVVEAGQEDSPEAREALEVLCKTYWYPLYAFARGLGRQPDSAEDLVQSFFAQMIEKNSLRSVDKTRGRFRTFLLTSFKRFTTNDWIREGALKRGGGERPISLDHGVGERRLEEEIGGHRAPDLEFERRWAVTLIENARLRLRKEFTKAGKEDRFDGLEPHLAGDATATTYAKLAKQFKITEGGVKAEAFRLRQRYRNHLRAEVGKTVTRPDEVDDEIAYLMSVLSQ